MSYSSRGVIDLVRAELANNPQVRLSAIASKYALSRSTIARALARDGLPSFRSLRSAAMMARAESALRNPLITVKEAAQACGASSAQSFARSVRRAAGICPTRIRGER